MQPDRGSGGLDSADTAPPTSSTAPTISAQPRISAQELAAIEATGVPWCLPDPDDPNGEIIVGAGPTIKRRCSWRHTHHVYLLHQAGATVLLQDRIGSWRVADGQLTKLEGLAEWPMLSHDGRFVVSIAGYCGDRRLQVYEVATAREVAASKVELATSDCPALWIVGIDDLGRVYVSSSSADGSNTDVYMDVYMFDMRTSAWTEVTGVPGGRITYVTAEGFAVETEGFDASTDSWSSHHSLASVEGVVDGDGRFVRQRQVPVGAGLWSRTRPGSWRSGRTRAWSCDPRMTWITLSRSTCPPTSSD